MMYLSIFHAIMKNVKITEVGLWAAFMYVGLGRLHHQIAFLA